MGLFVNLPSTRGGKTKSVNKFFHPGSPELILASSAVGVTFFFWNAINLSPSRLTSFAAVDPDSYGYEDWRNRIVSTMNSTLIAILGISAAFALLYGDKGYLASLSAAGTGVAMYLWSTSTMRKPTDTPTSEQPILVDSSSVSRLHAQSAAVAKSYQPARAYSNIPYLGFFS